MALGLVFLSVTAGPAGAQGGSPARPADWMRAERMRMIWMSMEDLQDVRLMERLKECGINSVVVHSASYDLMDAMPAITAAEKYGMHFFLSSHFRGGGDMPRAVAMGGRLYVREDGEQAKVVVCPRDPILWEAGLFGRAIPLARCSLVHPLVGGFLSDFENYGAYGEGAFDGLSYCYCDVCFGDFLKAKGIGEDIKDVAPSGRKHWLESRGLLEDFKHWEEEEVARVCRSQRERVDAINPNFLLGGYPNLEDYPLAWSMGQGFATERAPFVCMPENTYSGIRVVTTGIYEMARERGMPVFVAPGIRPIFNPPQRCLTELFIMGTVTDGYWLYEEVPYHQIFLERTQPLRFELAGTPEEWTELVTSANKEIDRWLADRSYFPELPLVINRLPKEMTPLKADDAVASGDMKVTAESWRDFFNAPFEGGQTRGETSKEGGTVSFDLGKGLPSDKYLFSLFHSMAPGFGRIQLLVDGEPVGRPIDCYSPRPLVAGPIAIGEKVLPAGGREVVFRVVGKNPDSSGYDCGVAGFRLQSLAPFVKHWMVLGPFPNPEGKGLDIDYVDSSQPEAKAEQGYIGKEGREVRWQWAEAAENGHLDLATFFNDQNASVAYAFTWVNVPEESVRRIWLGSDDGVKMWVNGAEVWKHPGDRGANPDTDFVDMTLKQGWNTILCAVSNTTGPWGLFLRVSDPDGKLKYSAVKGGEITMPGPEAQFTLHLWIVELPAVAERHAKTMAENPNDQSDPFPDVPASWTKPEDVEANLAALEPDARACYHVVLGPVGRGETASATQGSEEGEGVFSFTPLNWVMFAESIGYHIRFPYKKVSGVKDDNVADAEVMIAPGAARDFVRWLSISSSEERGKPRTTIPGHAYMALFHLSFGEPAAGGWDLGP